MIEVCLSQSSFEGCDWPPSCEWQGSIFGYSLANVELAELNEFGLLLSKPLAPCIS
jgi:hypothetical protein